MQFTTLINKFKNHLFSINSNLVATVQVSNKTPLLVKTRKTYSLHFATVWYKKPKSPSLSTFSKKKVPKLL